MTLHKEKRAERRTSDRQGVEFWKDFGTCRLKANEKVKRALWDRRKKERLAAHIVSPGASEFSLRTISIQARRHCRWRFSLLRHCRLLQLARCRLRPNLPAI
jgi:hypothetical protein